MNEIPDADSRNVCPTKVQWLWAAVFIVLILVLVGMVSQSPPKLIFDEPYHLAGAQLLADGASLHQLLTTPLESAPGPLYPCLHALLQPLTSLKPHGVRYVNLALLMLSMAGMVICLWLLGFTDPRTLVAMMMGVPMVWVTGGIALTQMPALLMMTAALLVAVWTMERAKEKQGAAYGGFALAGIFCGLGVIGRQTYLPALSSFAVVAFFQPRWRGPGLMAIFFALLISVPVFITWRGLVPPSQSHLAGGIVTKHGLLAFAYLALVVALIAPRYYAAKWKWCLGAGALVSLANLILFHFEWRAATGLATRLPPGVQAYYTIIIGSFGLAILAVFFVATAINFWVLHNDKSFIFWMGQALLLTATAFGVVHSFSSTYVMAAFPFLLLALRRFFVPSRWSVVRLVAGGMMGAGSLASYFWPANTNL